MKKSVTSYFFNSYFSKLELSLQNYWVVLFFIFCFSSLASGQPLISEIKLSKDLKNISNLSGKLNDSVTFHLLINFQKKAALYDLTPYIVDAENRLDSIKKIYFKEKPNFESFFSDGKTLTLISQLNGKLMLISLDYEQKTSSQNYLEMRPDKILSYQDFCLVFQRPVVFDQINFTLIRSKDSVTNIRVGIKNKKQRSFFKDLFSGTGIVRAKDKVDFINDRIYNEKGSIKPIKGFWHQKRFVFFSNDKGNRNFINIFDIDTKGKLTERSLDISASSASFISHKALFFKDDLIFVFKIENKRGQLSIFDFKTLQLLKTFNYDNNSVDNFNEVVVNGNTISKENFNPRKFLRGFNAKAMNTYSPSAYLGVNQDRTSKNYLIEIGHVHGSTYHYPNGGNKWWQYDEFFNHNSEFRGAKGMNAGSFVSFGMGMIAMANQEEKMKGNYLKLQLDQNLNFTNKEFIPQFQYFERDKYEKKYNPDRKLKKYFFLPLKNDVRLISFNKSDNSYSIFSLD